MQGRVQGVGFRNFVLRRAQSLDLSGWVRNQPNGDVELEAEGDRSALERLLELVREGPPSARVTGVLERWSESPPRHDRFVIRPDSNEP